MTPMPSDPTSARSPGRSVRLGFLVLGIVLGLIAGATVSAIGGGDDTDDAPTEATLVAPTTVTLPPTSAPDTSPPLMPPASSTGKVTVPVANDLVRSEQIVSGSVANVPPGHTVWVVVQVGRHYPQDGPLRVLPDGRWTTTAFIGRPTDVGKTFVVHLVETGPDGTAQFQSYLKYGRDTAEFPGIFLEDLAADIRFLDSVSVTRE
jgi:hypothetical protein